MFSIAILTPVQHPYQSVIIKLLAEKNNELSAFNSHVLCDCIESAEPILGQYFII